MENGPGLSRCISYWKWGYSSQQGNGGGVRWHWYGCRKNLKVSCYRNELWGCFKSLESQLAWISSEDFFLFHKQKDSAIAWKSNQHFWKVGLRTTILHVGVYHPKGVSPFFLMVVDFQGYLDALFSGRASGTLAQLGNWNNLTCSQITRVFCRKNGDVQDPQWSHNHLTFKNSVA